MLFARLGAYDRGGFAEEAIPFRQAFVLWGWGDKPPTLNPHFFNYPSFSIYLHWLVQWTASIVGVIAGRYEKLSDAGVEFVLDPTYLVSAARVSTFLSLAVTAWLAYFWWSARSLWTGVVVACLLCTSPLLVRSGLQLTPEILMCPGVLLVLLLLRNNRESVGFAPTLGCLASGAVCGIKYSALPLALLCVVVIASSEMGPARRLASAASSTAIIGLGFALTTPFAVLAWPEFRAGVWFELTHLGEGHLGGTHAHTFVAHARQLWEAMGVAIISALVGAAAFPRQMGRAGLLTLVGAATIALPAMGAKSGGPERYLVPCIPMAWLFVSECALALVSLRELAPRVVGAVCIVGAAVSLFGQAKTVFAAPARSSVAEASGWVRSNTRTDDIIVREYGTLTVYSTEDQASLMNSRCLAAASARWQEAARTTPAHDLVTIPFMAAGKVGATITAEDGAASEVDVFDPGWTMVPAFYEALRDVPVQYVVTSESIEGRLRSELARRLPGSQLHVPRGPQVFAAGVNRAQLDQASSIGIYRGAASRAGEPLLAARWWLANAVPAGRDGRDVIAADQLEAARRRVFLQRFRPFLMSLAVSALKRGDHLAAANAARLLVLEDGTDVVAIRVAMVAIDDGVRNVLQARDGVTRLTRAPAEARVQWLARVLTAWGVPGPIASEEVERFLGWRRAGGAGT